MNGTKLFGAIACILCGVAFFIGWKSVSGKTAIVRQPFPPSSPPASTPALPPDFGTTVYRNLGLVPFSEYYELLRRARPEVCVEWLRQLNDAPEGARKIHALCAFLRAFVRVDPAAACQMVAALPRHRAAAIDAMVGAAPPIAMPELAEMLFKLPDAARNYSLTDHLEIVISKWAQIDPHAVVRFLESCRERRDRQEQENPDAEEFGPSPLQYSGSLIRMWAGIDHAEAREWLEKQDKDEGESLWAAWLEGWFETDRDSAINYALAHLDDERIRSTLAWFSLSIFDQNQEQAIEYVKKLPTPEIRREALDGLARNATGGDSTYRSSTVAKCLVQFPMADWPKEQFGEVIANWLSEQPNECAGWVTQLPPEMQSRLIQQYPIPDLEPPNPEWRLMVVLNLPPSDFRKNLLEHLVPRLKSASRSVRLTVAEMDIPDRYKAEMLPLLPAGFGQITASPDPEEAR